MCYLKPKTQTPDSFSHISHQEQEKKEWEQLEETHRSWNLVFPVRFELAAAEMLAGNRPSRADRRKQRVRDGDRTQD